MGIDKKFLVNLMLLLIFYFECFNWLQYNLQNHKLVWVSLC